MTSPYITFSPNPPVAGAQLTICIHDGVVPDSGQITWEPSSITSPASVSWTTANGGCETIWVPSNATDIKVESEKGQCDALTSPVAQPTDGG